MTALVRSVPTSTAAENMTQPMEFEPYQYSVIDVAREIAESVCGSSGGIVAKEKVDWLRQRLSVWRPNQLERLAAYEDSVKAMAEASLAVFDGSWVDEFWKERTTL